MFGGEYFSAGVVVFDLFYTVFLNTISLEITPFNLSVCVVLAVGIGIGVGDVLKWCEGRAAGVVGVLKVGCGVIPLMFLVLNYRVSDQSENYTAYEHALNVFRTADHGAVLFMNGDNYIFPVTYGRIVERMREDVTLYDRNNILFKMPERCRNWKPAALSGRRKETRRKKRSSHGNLKKDHLLCRVWSCMPSTMPVSHELIPEGLLHRVFRKGETIHSDTVNPVWKYYSTESFYGRFERDFMNREICAYFFFSRGKTLVLSGRRSARA